MATSQWKQEVLNTHNALRSKHGSVPLTWSDECYAAAKRQADTCAARRALGHGNCDGPSGRHGQNAFWSSAGGATAKQAIDSWYAEAPKYRFGGNTQQPGTGHFTQIVWAGSQSVGVAKSADGCFVIANYFPAGNMLGTYNENVRPCGSPMSKPQAQQPQNSKPSGLRPQPGISTTPLVQPAQGNANGCFSGCCPWLSKSGGHQSNVSAAKPAVPNMQQGQKLTSFTITVTRGASTQQFVVSEGSRVGFSLGPKQLKGTVRGFDGNKARIQADGDAQGLLTVVQVTDLQPV